MNSWNGSISSTSTTRCLVGEPNRLQGIVTAMDILRYMYGVASPFVLIAEVELALRALMQLAVQPGNARGLCPGMPKGQVPGPASDSARRYDVQRLRADHR